MTYLPNVLWLTSSHGTTLKPPDFREPLMLKRSFLRKAVCSIRQSWVPSLLPGRYFVTTVPVYGWPGCGWFALNIGNTQWDLCTNLCLFFYVHMFDFLTMIIKGLNQSKLSCAYAGFKNPRHLNATINKSF